MMVTVFATVTARQAAHAARQRDLAEAERDKAEKVSRFLIDLFQDVDPWAGDGNTVTAREILDRGAERIEHQLSDQPELRASLLDAVGTVYLHLGLFEQARPLLEAALTARETLYGSDHVEVATTLHHIALLHFNQGRYDESEQLFRRRRALPQYRRDLGDEHALVANCLYELGNVLMVQGQLAEAEPFLIRARDVRERVLSADHPWVAESLRGLGDLRRAQQRYAEAEPLYRRALAIWEQHPRHEGTQGIPESYAALLRATGRPEAAAEVEYRALSAARAGS